MKISDTQWFPRVLQKLITAAMVAGGIIIIMLPWLVYLALKYYETNSNYDNSYFVVCLCILYPSGLVGFTILYQARKMLISINRFQPFIPENVKRMHNIARCSAVLCAIYAIAIFFINSFFVPILFVVFGLTALFTSVLGELFAKAVRYKEENDYTI